MKKLLLLATAIGATALVAPRAQAGISFGIRIGPDFHRPAPVYVAPPVHCAPPVYVAPRAVCPPVVVAPPVYYAPPPVVYYGHRSHGWRHQHRYHGYRHDAYHGQNRHHYRH